ncbi:cytochrome c family protein [Blastomonas sp.]|uniref:c-type cytochrome n=1 Tax=Blastomonas sp. TaxID=1909299 RepID=UPI002606E791|nr:cytochrome c family protein [Blastomonas sp.]MDM7957679.1 cytochrome c family protein [Blastomonas sp.]
MNALRYSGAFAGLALLAACSGGSETPAAEENAAAPAADAPAATPTPAAAEAPAADNTDTLDGTKFADMTGVAAEGEKVFIQCKTCHVKEAGQNRVGPSLAGIVGRAAGTVEGFNYSPANKNSGITWTPEKLFQYLEKPARVVPGTKMVFAGLPDAQKRADLIAYLQQP